MLPRYFLRPLRTDLSPCSWVDGWHWAAEPSTVASCLRGVALAGGIPVILLGSFIVITTPVLALGADGDRPETLLYQNTNTPLTIQVGH